MPLIQFAPCKVNLLLNILRKRPDGFHELETLFHPVGLHDELEFGIAGDRVELSCDHPGLSIGPENLVVQAAHAFLQHANINRGARIRLVKRIPLAAGLGGGSSNAAHTLLGLNELFGHPITDSNLHRLAAQLGSDVPFFLQNRPALGLGRGEVIRPLEPFSCLKAQWIVLVHPGFGVPTAWAYQNLAKFPQALNGRAGRAQELIDTLRHKPFSEAAKCFYNSLEAPVLNKFPILALFQKSLRSYGALAVLMSGSGSTTFALAQSQEAAQELSGRFRSCYGASSWTAEVPLV